MDATAFRPEMDRLKRDLVVIGLVLVFVIYTTLTLAFSPRRNR